MGIKFQNLKIVNRRMCFGSGFKRKMCVHATPMLATVRRGSLLSVAFHMTWKP